MNQPLAEGLEQRRVLRVRCELRRLYRQIDLYVPPQCILIQTELPRLPAAWSTRGQSLSRGAEGSQVSPTTAHRSRLGGPSVAHIYQTTPWL